MITQEINRSIRTLTFAERSRLRGAVPLKYMDVAEVFSEVPDECALAVNISGCPCGCPGCHSPWLRNDDGQILDEDAVDVLLKKHPLVTCIAFMGGDADPHGVGELCAHVKDAHPGIRTCWYSGRPFDADAVPIPFLDYYKCGPWMEEFGPLDSPATNQRMYRVGTAKDGSRVLRDITDWFRREKALI